MLLARSAAPYTVDQPLELMRRAWDAGAVPVLILDGLNECPGRAGAGTARAARRGQAARPCGVRHHLGG